MPTAKEKTLIEQAFEQFERAQQQFREWQHSPKKSHPAWKKNPLKWLLKNEKASVPLNSLFLKSGNEAWWWREADEQCWQHLHDTGQLNSWINALRTRNSANNQEFQLTFPWTEWKNNEHYPQVIATLFACTTPESFPELWTGLRRKNDPDSPLVIAEPSFIMHSLEANDTKVIHILQQHGLQMHPAFLTTMDQRQRTKPLDDEISFLFYNSNMLKHWQQWEKEEAVAPLTDRRQLQIWIEGMNMLQDSSTNKTIQQQWRKYFQTMDFPSLSLSTEETHATLKIILNASEEIRPHPFWKKILDSISGFHGTPDTLPMWAQWGTELIGMLAVCSQDPGFQRMQEFSHIRPWEAITQPTENYGNWESCLYAKYNASEFSLKWWKNLQTYLEGIQWRPVSQQISPWEAWNESITNIVKEHNSLIETGMAMAQFLVQFPETFLRNDGTNMWRTIKHQLQTNPPLWLSQSKTVEREHFYLTAENAANTSPTKPHNKVRL